jgi:hypothetical protein
MSIFLRMFKELLDIIIASPNPQAALERAKTAAATEALNVAADEALKRMP